MNKALQCAVAVAVVVTLSFFGYLRLHPAHKVLGMHGPFPGVSLQTKARLFEIRLSYYQDLEVIARLQADQHTIDGKIADKVKGLAPSSQVPDDVLDLRLKWKQDEDAIKSIQNQQPQIEAQFTSTIASAVKAAHLPETYTITVPNSLAGIKFVLNPQGVPKK